MGGADCLPEHSMNGPDRRYRDIIFDFGGVLIDWNPRYLYRKFFDGDTASMERFLTEIRFHEWNLEQDRGRPFSSAVAELCERFPTRAELIKAYDERWEESIAGPIQTTVTILGRLKQGGYRLHGLSNWSVEKFAIVRPRYEFFSWFDTILVSGEVRLVKPDPRIFAVLLDRIGSKPEECLFIDDSMRNVIVADQLGFKAIHFESAERLDEELRSLVVLPESGGRP
jgi:2-haloacid dehalogenase